MRIEAERLHIGPGFQEVGEARAPGERADGLPPLPQGPYKGAGDLCDGCAHGAGQQQRLGDVGHGRLHLLRHRFAEPAGQAAAAQVLIQVLAGVLGLLVAAQRQVEGEERAAEGAKPARIVSTRCSKSAPAERDRSIRTGRIVRCPTQVGAPHCTGRPGPASAASSLRDSVVLPMPPTP
ncbi:hypothetical protein [Streptomyces sp. NPDC058011]|uniref:hypothetical protein n=1 Tax=Streptomyces sp. NPDC058011 TaxID=3346305 RepID=UPI0036EC3A80